MVATSIAVAHIFRVSSTEAHHPYSEKKKPFVPMVLHFYKSDSMYFYYSMYALQFLISATAATMNVLSIAVCVGFINFLSCEVEVLSKAFEGERKIMESELHINRKRYTSPKTSKISDQILQESEIANDPQDCIHDYDRLKTLVDQHNKLLR